MPFNAQRSFLKASSPLRLSQEANQTFARASMALSRANLEDVYTRPAANDAYFDKFATLNHNDETHVKKTTTLSDVADGQKIYVTSGDVIVEGDVGHNVCIFSSGGGDVIIYGNVGNNFYLYTEGHLKAGHIGSYNEIVADSINIKSAGHNSVISANGLITINSLNTLNPSDRSGLLGNNSLVQGHSAEILKVSSGSHVIVVDRANLGFIEEETLIQGNIIHIHHIARGGQIKASTFIDAYDLTSKVVAIAPQITAKHASHSAVLNCDSITISRFYRENQAVNDAFFNHTPYSHAA